MSFQLEPERAAPPPKRARLPKGCWIALILFGVLGVVTTVALVVLIYAISQNPEVRRVARVVNESMQIVQQAQTAPGTSEVRQLGCDQAMVLEASQLARLERQLSDDMPEPNDDVQGRIVMCQVVVDRPAPPCQLVAQIYVMAVPNQPGDFTVIVQTSSQRGECSARYDANGRLLQHVSGNPPPATSTSSQPPSLSPFELHQ